MVGVGRIGGLGWVGTETNVIWTFPLTRTPLLLLSRS
jgi:hypothetical protein